MAGIKHHLQQYGYLNHNLYKIEDPIERDLAFKTMSVTPYCKKCGEPILEAESSKDNPAGKVDYQMELRMGMHQHCANEVERELKAKHEAELRKKEEEAKKFDWESYMEQMMNKKEE